jgi:hypothetical protein
MARAQAEPEAVAAPVDPTVPVRTLDSELSLGEARQARIDLSLGDVVVRGEEIDRVAVRLLIFCDKKPRDQGECDEHARDLAIRGASDGEEIRIGVEHVSRAVTRRLRLRLEVRLPRQFATEIHVRAGQVRLDDMLGDSEIDVEKGTIDVAMPESAVAELELRARGEVWLDRGEERFGTKGILSGPLLWTRPGSGARVKAECALGDVRVVLN